MNRIFVALICLVLFKAVCAELGKNKVVALTTKDFYTRIQSDKWFIMFHAPWCLYCKQAMPTWESLASETKLEGFQIASVDCVSESLLCKKFNIRGYPTFILVENGNYYVFNSKRTIEDFSNFALSGYQNVESKEIQVVQFSDRIQAYLETWLKYVGNLYINDFKTLMMYIIGLVAIFILLNVLFCIAIIKKLRPAGAKEQKSAAPDAKIKVN
ncbi:thioredoxin domain-containing protein-like [Schistocerca gregaria]|uniref:thioredoxin domain-containing protein-like n=1 Tax=Schistocerca gregaria TaxID=7010 RepID=UPI00211DF606|nr:thioredoxin domain-containing protein-like [Schistocerca gregaria]